MTLDLIIRNATLPDGRSGQDIGVAGGLITAVAPRLEAEAEDNIDVGGYLLSPPFVDPHFHMDATLSLGQPRLNQSGTLLEGIALWGELKPLLTHEALVERALRYCDLAVSQGLLAIRSHVDIGDPRLLTAQALLDVRERVKPYIDLQLVAFPQDGYFRAPGAAALLDRALDMGIEIVGGIPHFERTMEEGRRSVEALFRIAADRGLAVDMHCDESDDPLSRHVETMAAEAQRYGLGGRVAASHVTSLHSVDNYYASKLIALIAESGMTVISNPLINITLQGRHDSYPKRRGLTRVPELLAAGVNVAFGQDCCMDPWYALGGADMLDVAHMGLHVAQMTSQEAMRTCFEMVTSRGAQAMGLEGYGIAPGCRADLVLLQAQSPAEAIRLRATRLLVIKAGHIIAQSEPREAALFLNGRPGSVNPAAYAPRLASRRIADSAIELTG
jgi:cytosine deaminase